MQFEAGCDQEGFFFTNRKQRQEYLEREVRIIANWQLIPELIINIEDKKSDSVILYQGENEMLLIVGDFRF